MKTKFAVLAMVFLAGIARGQNTEVKSDSLKNEDSEYVVVENNASYPGGMTAFYEFAKKNIVYPKSMKRGAAIKVFVEFIIEKDGSINDESVRALDNGLDNAECKAEAVRLVRLCGDWIPGTHKNDTVRQMMVLPMIFKR
jgi:periplasmic protein TonB